MKKSLIFILSFVFVLSSLAQELTLQSPNGKLKVKVEIDDQISFSVHHEHTEVIATSPVSMSLNNGTVWGVNPKLINKKTKFVNQIVTPPFYKKSKIQEEYHELTLKFKGNYSVIFLSI